MAPLKYLLSILLLMVGVVGCGSAPESSPSSGNLTKVTLALNWFPEAEHGGYYAALVNGYFEEEGLDVEIQPGGPGVPIIQNVATKRVMFGVANADQVLVGRNEQADVVALLAPLQMSPRCIMVHEKSGIRRLEDLKDMTLAAGSGKAYLEYLKTQVTLENVKLVPYAGSSALFLKDENFAQQGYVFSEPFVARREGANPHVLMVSEIGFNPYTSLLVTHGETISDQEELVAKVVRASRRGWQDYLADPKTINAYIHKVNPEMDMESLQFGVEAIQPLCLPENMPPTELGVMSLERWQALSNQLKEIDWLDAQLDPATAFESRFIEAVPGS
ncbi:MAG: ABC transporter substrate-binding protein [Planctomycetaceae bacterium]|nr:ABC transporter substrate-binding protein [Planctomycetaceae bacterium]